MTRPADLTRQSILRAAINLFAEKGFEGASVRDIVARAKVNQAAINYHFEGKEGLYAEVLKAALDALTRQAADAAALTDLPREAALRQFVYEQLRPLLHRDEAARYMRIFAWENVQPTKVMRKFTATNATPYLRRSLDLLRRFLPTDTPERDLMCAAIWLMGQCSIFVRNRENFAQPPFAMKIDEAFVDGLTDLVTRLAIGGLTQGQLALAAG